MERPHLPTPTQPRPRLRRASCVLNVAVPSSLLPDAPSSAVLPGRAHQSFRYRTSTLPGTWVEQERRPFFRPRIKLSSSQDSQTRMIDLCNLSDGERGRLAGGGCGGG
jgi:hypothetical protein